MAGAVFAVDCSDLDSYRVFGDYTSLLRDRTSFNDTLLRLCQQPICQALWGYGVPDLSGIGVAIGYTLSVFISTILTLSLLSNSPRWQATTLQKILTAGLSSFFESAVYFTLAIQIATITILAPKDMETRAVSIGHYEVRIAGLVSTLCLLPLLVPPLFLSGASSARHRHPYRLSILSFTVLLSVYTFLSQSIRYWTPSPIGKGKGEGGNTYIDDEEFSTVWNMCFQPTDAGSDISPLSHTEHVILGAFHMIASLIVLLLTVAILTPIILQRIDARNEGVQGPIRQRTGDIVKSFTRAWNRGWVKITVVLVPFSLTIPLLWGFWRLRGLQEQLAVTAYGHYEGNDWGFGQVMAIAIFAPVGAEMLFVWVQAQWEDTENDSDEVKDGEAMGFPR